MRRLIGLGLVASVPLWNCSGSEHEFGGGGGTSSGEAGASQSAAGEGAKQGGAGGTEAGAPTMSGGEPTASGGDTETPSTAGAGGVAEQEPAPPPGAFAWYKATEEDLVVTKATLADGNDFIKSFWTKTNLSAEALQPDMDGGTSATALYSSGGTLERSMRHVVDGARVGITTFRVRARMGEARYLWLGMSQSGAGQYWALFDLLDGRAYAGKQARITPLKNLWYLCEATVIANEVFTSIGVSYSTQKSSTGASTSKPLVWVAQAEVEQRAVATWRDRIGGRNFIASPNGSNWVASTEGSGVGAIEVDATVYSPAKLEAGDPSDWRFLHDGSGGTIVVRAESSFASKGQVALVQTEYGLANEGVHLGLSAELNAWRYNVTNSSTQDIFALSGGSTLGAHWLAGSFSSDQQPQARLFEDGILVDSADAEYEPAVTSGNLPLTLGGPGTGNQKVHEVLVYDRALDADDMSQLKRYFDQQSP